MSGIGGLGSSSSYEFSHEEVPAPAAEAEAQVVRGTSPQVGALMADKVLDMSATRLQAQLRQAEGMTKAEAKQAATEIKKTAEEIQELEGRLEDLQELEKMYVEMLKDPNLDLWESSWIDWDLWDVRMEIYDIQDQLGQLTGDLKDLLGNAWSALSGLFQIGSAFRNIETTDIDRQRKDRDVEKSFQKRSKDRADRHGQDDASRLDELKKKGLVTPVPPKSDESKKIIDAARKKVEERGDDRSKDLLDEIRSDLKEARTKA